MIEKLDQQTLNFTDEHIANIAVMFPHCVTEVEDESGTLKQAIDFDLLKQELSSNIVDGPKERYRIDWPGKRASLLSANTPISKTLRPARDESVDFDTTQNLYIEGDNLEALKLLQESYLGEIKMIYIDPPYNTGKDFVYKDNFTRSKEAELEASGQVDAEGGRLVANLESNGRFHSDWLSMMYPRLRLARNLLKEDGVIFISIDDNEVHNLRKICDEIFGEDNFIVQTTLQSNPRGSQASKHFAVVHESILCYAKKADEFKVRGYIKEGDDLKDYSLTDERGKAYRLLGLRQRGGAWRREQRPNMYYPIYIDPSTGDVSLEESDIFSKVSLPARPSGEDSRWTWGKETFQLKRHLLVGRKVTREGLNEFWDIFRKDYVEDDSGNVKATKPKSIWIEKELNYQNGRVEIKELFGNSEIFDFPKPTSIMTKILSMLESENDDIFLDFFSGSGTSAHAVMQNNVENKTHRKFIMVQIPEKTDEQSEAFKAGYETIAEIGKERIRRAGRKIKEENADNEGIDNLDIGFRVLKIDESNMKDIYFTPDQVDKTSLFDTVDHIKEDRTAEDLLFGVLLDWGVDLTLPIQREEILGKTVFFVGEDALTACFDEGLDEAFITELASRDTMRVVFKESGFKNDETKINAEQIFAQLSPGTDLRVI